MQRTKRHDRAKATQHAKASGAGVVNPRARQRAFCIGVTPAVPADDHLDELKELLRTARVAVSGELIQRRPHPDPNVYLGKGKLVELQDALRETNANVVACDDELTPRQERNLEEAVGMPVIDRTAVILDIFADHAASAEGKLQVELAQLEYNMARMRGLWTHLERLGGGIGTRGPGESQIETDRRLARDRIAQLKRRLAEKRAHRDRMRKERQGAALPNLALAGYTNAGKSTLMNALTGTEVTADSRLFVTLDATTRTYRHCGRTYLLTDTVGFIRKLPHQLVEAFRATLQETIEADLILHVVDASMPEEELGEMIDAVDDVLVEIGAAEIRTLLVLNKIDLVEADRRRELQHRHPEAALVSAAESAGIEELQEAIERLFESLLQPIELLVPFSEGALLSELHAVAGDLEREDTPTGVRVVARVPAPLVSRLEPYRIDLTNPEGGNSSAP